LPCFAAPCMCEILPRFASNSEISAGEFSSPRTFVNGFVLLSKILRIFCGNFVWYGKISRPFRRNIVFRRCETSVIFLEKKARISFALLFHSHVHPHSCLPAPSLATAAFLFLTETLKNRAASRLSNSVAAANWRTPLCPERKRHLTSKLHECSTERPFKETPPGEKLWADQTAL